MAISLVADNSVYHGILTSKHYSQISSDSSYAYFIGPKKEMWLTQCESPISSLSRSAVFPKPWRNSGHAWLGAASNPWDCCGRRLHDSSDVIKTSNHTPITMSMLFPNINLRNYPVQHCQKNLKVICILQFYMEYVYMTQVSQPSLLFRNLPEPSPKANTCPFSVPGLPWHGPLPWEVLLWTPGDLHKCIQT